MRTDEPDLWAENAARGFVDEPTNQIARKQPLTGALSPRFHEAQEQRRLKHRLRMAPADLLPRDETLLRRKDLEGVARTQVRELIRRHGVAFVMNACRLEMAAERE